MLESLWLVLKNKHTCWIGCHQELLTAQSYGHPHPKSPTGGFRQARNSDPAKERRNFIQYAQLGWGVLTNNGMDIKDTLWPHLQEKKKKQWERILNRKQTTIFFFKCQGFREGREVFLQASWDLGIAGGPLHANGRSGLRPATWTPSLGAPFRAGCCSLLV